MHLRPHCRVSQFKAVGSDEKTQESVGLYLSVEKENMLNNRYVDISRSIL